MKLEKNECFTAKIVTTATTTTTAKENRE